MAPVGGGNIKVVVRVRPFNSRGESTKYAVHTFPLSDARNLDTMANGRLHNAIKQNSTEEQNVLCR